MGSFYSNGKTWIKKRGGGGGGVATLTMGIRNFNLQRGQVRKMGKIGLKAGLSFFCLYTTRMIIYKIFLFFFLFAPHRFSSQKNLFLRRNKKITI